MSLLLNNERIIVDHPLSIRILDSSGNSISSNAGALRVSFTGSTFNIKDSISNNILTTNNSLRTADYTNDLINSVYVSGFSTSNTLVKKNMYRDIVSVSGSDITTNTNDSYPWISSACSLNVSSSSASDDSGGTGALTIAVTGINNGNVASTTVYTMNGTSNAAPNGGDTYLYINSATVVTCGSNKANVGKITISNATTGEELANIQPNLSVSLNSNLTMPPGTNAILRRLNIQSLGPANVYLMYSASGSSVWQVIDMCLVNGNLTKDICYKLTPGDSFKLYAVSLSGSTPVSAQMEYLNMYG
jgi:hypothetical protein